MAARIAIDHKIFDTLLNSGKESVTLANLSDASGLESNMLESVMNIVCAHGMVGEPEPGIYRPTRVTHFMTLPLFHEGIIQLYASLVHYSPTPGLS